MPPHFHHLSNSKGKVKLWAHALGSSLAVQHTANARGTQAQSGAGRLLQTCDTKCKRGGVPGAPNFSPNKGEEATVPSCTRRYQHALKLNIYAHPSKRLLQAVELSPLYSSIALSAVVCRVLSVQSVQDVSQC